MKRTQIELLRLFGIPIRLHPTWFLIAALVVWSLATSAFPAELPGLTVPAYWLMAVAGALGLFGSIVVHESCHALVARRNGIPMSGITLFVFGGVAEMEGEPATAGAELRMAAAGPAASVALALLGFGLAAVARDIWPEPVLVVLRYFALLNAVLAGFNLVPGFPLDGGRILRAALWKRTGDLQGATRVASRIGSGFGVVLLSVGVLGLLTGALMTGLWWILIGLFVRTAATQSYTQVRVRYLLQGQTVRDFTGPVPASVPLGVSVAEFLQRYALRHGAGLLPVSDDGRLVGSLSASRVMGVPRPAWEQERIDRYVEPGGPETVVAPETDAMQALTLMTRAGRPRLLVVDGGRLLGTISQRDVLDYCSAAMELDLGRGATSARSTSP
jgi:Zn-dependent protease